MPVVIAVFLPIALGIVMLGLGLSLTVADFVRVGRRPKAVIVVLICQFLVLPLVCLGLLTVFGTEPVLAAGMMLLMATPGGTAANLLSHLAGGDVAFNITLTAIASALSVAAFPIIANLSLRHFLGGGPEVGLGFDKVLQVTAVLLIPVAIGMTIRRWRPSFAARTRRPVKIASAVILVIVVALALIGDRGEAFTHLGEIGAVALLMGVVNLTIGYLVPRLLRVGPRQAISAAMEIGVHNATVAVTVALSPAMLNSPRMALGPGIYALEILIIAPVFAYLVGRPLRRAAAEPVAADA